jgi:hypothetical protein
MAVMAVTAVRGYVAKKHLHHEQSIPNRLGGRRRLHDDSEVDALKEQAEEV